jgi:hypothetical protein
MQTSAPRKYAQERTNHERENIWRLVGRGGRECLQSAHQSSRDIQTSWAASGVGKMKCWMSRREGQTELFSERERERKKITSENSFEKN